MEVVAVVVVVDRGGGGGRPLVTMEIQIAGRRGHRSSLSSLV